MRGFVGLVLLWALCGARVRIGARVTLAAIHDGVNVHPARDLGIAHSVSF